MFDSEGEAVYIRDFEVEISRRSARIRFKEVFLLIVGESE